jgi:ribosomal protein S18 acetylase RimI-like enzyme
MHRVKLCASEEDHARLCALLTEAFRDDPISRWVYGSEVDSGHSILFREGLDVRRAAMTANGHGAIIWSEPPECEAATAVRVDQDSESLTPWDDRLSILIQEFAVAEAKAVGDRHSVHVFYIGAHPKGGGHGSAVLRHVLAEADRRKLPTYLETPRNNIPFYEKHGFTVRAEGALTHQKESVAFFAMVRDPR